MVVMLPPPFGTDRGSKLLDTYPRADLYVGGLVCRRPFTLIRPPTLVALEPEPTHIRPTSQFVARAAAILQPAPSTAYSARKLRQVRYAQAAGGYWDEYCRCQRYVYFVGSATAVTVVTGLKYWRPTNCPPSSKDNRRSQQRRLFRIPVRAPRSGNEFKAFRDNF